MALFIKSLLDVCACVLSCVCDYLEFNSYFLHVNSFVLLLEIIALVSFVFT